MPHDPDPLAKLLTSWQPELPPAPDFSAEVHRRIARVERADHLVRNAESPSLWQQLGAWLTGGVSSRVTRSAWPLAASVIMLASGLAGSWLALAGSPAADTEQMAARFVAAVDPLQMAASQLTHHAHAAP